MSNVALSLSSRRRLTPMVLAVIVALASSLSFSPADARLGGGSSFGSRGSRTFSAPHATATAPRVAPIQRSATPAGGFGRPGFSRPGFFGGGFGRGLLGGFLGAGLFGLLFGHGFGGGLGGGMSIIGLLLQLGLIYLVFRFVMSYFRSRQQPASGMGPTYGSSGTYGAQTGGWGGGVNAAAPQGTPITLAPEDYKTFEQRLIESQAAYSNGDVGALRRVSTPEMSQTFEQELQENDRQGVENKLSDVRLVSGDLSEAWRESSSDYATVAMRFSLIDRTVDKRSGRVVNGNPAAAQIVTEVWTFVRSAGSGADAWVLSGIQQA